jgi:hypothetical protein
MGINRRLLGCFACCLVDISTEIFRLNWVHSAHWPLNGLLYLPRVIVMTENSVEWRLAGETEVLGETYPSATLSTTKPTCQTRARTRAAAVGSQRLTAWAMARLQAHLKQVPEWFIPFSTDVLWFRPTTVGARSKAWTVFVRSNVWIVGYNRTQGIDVCVCVYSVFVLSCV